MDLPMLLSMLSMPPHCHRALLLRCSKVPGSGSGICLLEKLIIILLSQHKTICVLKIKYNFFWLEDNYPRRQAPVQVKNRSINNKTPEEEQWWFIVNFE